MQRFGRGRVVGWARGFYAYGEPGWGASHRPLHAHVGTGYRTWAIAGHGGSAGPVFVVDVPERVAFRVANAEAYGGRVVDDPRRRKYAPRHVECGGATS